MNTIITDAVLYQALLESTHGESLRDRTDFRDFSETFQTLSAKIREYVLIFRSKRRFNNCTYSYVDPS